MSATRAEVEIRAQGITLGERQVWSRLRTRCS